MPTLLLKAPTPPHRRAGLALALAALLAAGCGGGDRPKLVPASGKVYFNGKPLVGVDVVFQPVDGAPPEQRPASGTLDADGAFDLRTGEFGRGATVGKYKLIVSGEHRYGRGLDKFTQPKTSTAVVDVPADGLKGAEVRLN